MNFSVGLMSLLISCGMLSLPIAAMEETNEESNEETNNEKTNTSVTVSGVPGDVTLFQQFCDYVGLTPNNPILEALRLAPNKQIFKAIYAADIEKVEQCLRDGASLTSKNDEGDTPEEYARKQELSLLANALRDVDFNRNRDAIIEEADRLRDKIREYHFNRRSDGL